MESEITLFPSPPTVGLNYGQRHRLLVKNRAAAVLRRKTAERLREELDALRGRCWAIEAWLERNGAK